MKKVYACIGQKRVGKDTAADYICGKLGCKKHALATPLKELVCNMLNINMEALDKLKNEKWSMWALSEEEDNEMANIKVSFRSILQRCGDSQKEFFGLDCYMRKLHEKLLHEDVIVVPDVRLLEEQKWLMAHTDVTFIKIVRSVKMDNDSAHRTEVEVDELGYDVLIDNDGTIEELYVKIDEVIGTKKQCDECGHIIQDMFDKSLSGPIICGTCGASHRLTNNQL